MNNYNFRRNWVAFLWHGFDWPKITGHINTAKGKLDKEPDLSNYERFAPWDIHRGALLEGGDGRRREITDLLAQLQELTVVTHTV